MPDPTTSSGEHSTEDQPRAVRDPAGAPSVLFELIKEPKDNTDWAPWSGFGRFALSGVETFRMQFRTETGGNAAQIRRARMEVWRVS